jgi:hypothetical protein
VGSPRFNRRRTRAFSARIARCSRSVRQSGQITPTTSPSSAMSSPVQGSRLVQRRRRPVATPACGRRIVASSVSPKTSHVPGLSQKFAGGTFRRRRVSRPGHDERGVWRCLGKPICSLTKEVARSSRAPPTFVSACKSLPVAHLGREEHPPTGGQGTSREQADAGQGSVLARSPSGTGRPAAQFRPLPTWHEADCRPPCA